MTASVIDDLIMIAAGSAAGGLCPGPADPARLLPTIADLDYKMHLTLQVL